MWIRTLCFSAAIMACSSAASVLAADGPAVYDTPQDALDVFSRALAERDRDEMRVIFGPEAEDLLSTGNEGRDKANRAAVMAMILQGYRFQPDEDRVVLLLGADGWPFPIPLMRVDAGWQFDIEAGRDEVLARRIGLNELDVSVLLEAYVDLQSEFRLTDHDEDGVMEFARAVISEPGARDGLFWPDEGGFVGAALARAAAFGWSDGDKDRSPEPFSGYYFKILHGQTANAPGGEASYLLGDNLVGGHAMLAFPAIYGETGLYSFMVGENGVVLEADLGEDTLGRAAAITAFDPGPEWRVFE